MCDEKKCCEKPDRLKGTPQECTAGQIITCHGDAKVHPCVSTKGCHDPARLKKIQKPAHLNRFGNAMGQQKVIHVKKK